MSCLWGSVVDLVPAMIALEGGSHYPSHVSLGFLSSFNGYLPQHILVQDMVAPAPLGCSPASLLPERRLSFCNPPEGPSFPCHAPSRATLPAGLSRSSGALPGPATSSVPCWRHGWMEHLLLHVGNLQAVATAQLSSSWPVGSPGRKGERGQECCAMCPHHIRPQGQGSRARAVNQWSG